MTYRDRRSWSRTPSLEDSQSPSGTARCLAVALGRKSRGQEACDSPSVVRRPEPTLAPSTLTLASTGVADPAEGMMSGVAGGVLPASPPT